MHFQVLRLLEANPNCTQRELAQQLGVSLGRANYCLRALIDKGWMKVENFKASGKKCGYAYILTPQGIAQKVALTGHFLQRKLVEFEALKAEIEALQRKRPEEGVSIDISTASRASRRSSR